MCLILIECLPVMALCQTSLFFLKNFCLPFVIQKCVRMGNITFFSLTTESISWPSKSLYKCYLLIM